MNQHWKRNIVIAGLTVALGMPVVSVYADRDYESSKRNDDEEPKIVREARIVEEGRNEKLETTAKADGQVWLYDASKKEVVHSITLKKGQRYGIDPKHDYVIVNGKEGERFKFNNRSTYRIYYVTEEDRDARHAASDGKQKERRERLAREKVQVPDGATLVAEGRDEDLTARARERGTFWLYDNTNKRTIETFNVSDGDRLIVSPKNNAIAFNDQRISRDVPLSRENGYKLFFEKHD
jgi:hypothetical protein